MTDAAGRVRPGTPNALVMDLPAARQAHVRAGSVITRASNTVTGGAAVDVNRRIEELLDYVDSARQVPLSRSVMVSREEISALVDRIAQALPASVREASAVLDQREDILADARREADEMRRFGHIDAEAIRGRADADAEEIVRRAHEQASALVDDHEVMTQARVQANAMLQHAEQQADSIRREAEDYADSRLAEFEDALGGALGSVQRGRDRLRGRQA